MPYAFTEHGAIQAANVLNSPRAVGMGIYVVRAFVQLRELLSSNKDLARRLDQLEARIEKKLATLRAGLPVGLPSSSASAPSRTLL